MSTAALLCSDRPTDSMPDDLQRFAVIARECVAPAHSVAGHNGADKDINHSGRDSRVVLMAIHRTYSSGSGQQSHWRPSTVAAFSEYILHHFNVSTH